MTAADAQLKSEQAAWATEACRDYYRAHRRTPADLYPSERFFLPEVLGRVSTCLDVGCALGHFSRIMKSFNPALQYTGMDANPAFVAAAQREHPDSRFLTGNGMDFRTPPGSYDLVHLSGVLHLTSFYREITAACYAQARTYLLCDFRLTRGPSVTGRLKPHVSADDPGTPELPYVVLNAEEWLAWLKRLSPAPRSIRARGYPHPPSPGARLSLKDIIAAFFLIEKGPARGETAVDVDFNALPKETES